MRTIIVVLAIAAAFAALIVVASPTEAPGNTQIDVSRIIYALGAALLFGAAALSARYTSSGEKIETGPGPLTSLAIWLALFAVAVLLYRATWFWAGFASLFSG